MNCPNCQAENPANARFCWNCGTGLGAPRLSQGERKFVTILFADVVGSTAMGEQLDPEHVAEIMNGAFPLLNAAVARYGGTVARLMGDAILALFGAPVAHEDDAERAVRAALAIQEAAGQYAQEVKQSYGVEFSMRVGIHSGLAVLTVVGDEVKTEYTAMGDAANTAARMQGAAEPQGILISADTYHLVKNLFDFKPQGAIEVKGKSAPVETYEVVAARTTPGKVRGLEGVTSPLVGRDAELELLRARVEALVQGNGAFAAVVGEAGLGKSRLLAEMRTWAKALHPEIDWLEGRALSYGQTIAYYPWRQVMRQAIGAFETDPPEAVREKLGAECERLEMSGDEARFLEVMLAVESRETRDAVAALRGDERVERIAEVTRRFLSGRALVTPSVVVLDDLHWADEASLQLLLQVASLVREQPLLLVCLLRPDRNAASWSTMERIEDALGERFFTFTLEPLSAGNAQELLGNLLYVEDLPEGVRSLILRKSEGNPFFLEEVLRSLIDSRHIVRENNHWRATGDIVDVAIPDTLAGVLSARIDRLPEDTKRLTQTAAVIGRIFPYPVLREACATAPPAERIENPQPHLATLTEEELVRERMHDPEIEYIFKHALTQEAAYDLLLLRRRKDDHRRVGEVLERLYPQQLDDLAPLLAHHFWLGEDWMKAAGYAMRAGAAAEKVYAQREALDHYSRAYQALQRLSDPPREAVYDAILAWAPIAARFQPADEVLERLAQAEGIARELSDNRRLATALNWIGNVHLLAGFPSRAVPALIDSSRLATEVGDEMLALLPTFMMTSRMVDRDPRAGLEQLDGVIELARTSHAPDIEAHALAIKAVAHARLGEFERARGVIQRALELVQRIGAPVKEADVNALAAQVYFDLGEVERGLEHSRLATQKASEVQVTECAVYGMYCTGLGNLYRQDWIEAQTVFEESARRSEALGNEYISTFTGAGLAMAQSLGGSREAIEDMEHARTEALALGEEYTVALLSRALAESYTELGELDQAETYLDAALLYYRQRDMRPYLARALQSLGRLRDRQGRAADAQDARAAAERLTQDLLTPAASGASSLASSETK